MTKEERRAAKVAKLLIQGLSLYENDTEVTPDQFEDACNMACASIKRGMPPVKHAAICDAVEAILSHYGGD